MHMQELSLPWLITEDFFKKKKMCQWNLFMISRIKVYDKYKSSMFTSRDVHVCIYFSKITWSHLRCYTYTDYTYTRCLLVRHLNMECFKSAVPAIFLSYAPTFFVLCTLTMINRKWRCLNKLRQSDNHRKNTDKEELENVLLATVWLWICHYLF